MGTFPHSGVTVHSSGFWSLSLTVLQDLFCWSNKPWKCGGCGGGHGAPLLFQSDVGSGGAEGRGSTWQNRGKVWRDDPEGDALLLRAGNTPEHEPSSSGFLWPPSFGISPHFGRLVPIPARPPRHCSLWKWICCHGDRKSSRGGTWQHGWGTGTNCFVEWLLQTRCWLWINRYFV